MTAASVMASLNEKETQLIQLTSSVRMSIALVFPFSF